MYVELKKKVIDLDVVERELQSSANSGSSGGVVTHEGCVATTSDRQKYLIEFGVAPDDMVELRRIGGVQGSRIVKLGAEMPQGYTIDNDKKVSVIVKDVTLLALLEASGAGYHWLWNNCRNATQRMVQLVSGERVWPWQMKTGATWAVIVGVVAILFVVLVRLPRAPTTH